jgi:hypothetical protein
MAVVNTLVYFGKATIMLIKCFKVKAPGHTPFSPWGPHVLPMDQIGDTLSEAFSTGLTSERSLPGMDALMILKIRHQG